ncbi:GntR family transcriptional regulator [Neorhizobium sp. NCHU2750]|uniref:GntR family transcriptional regulator n=1 Tax=Neorhizobium sp. NCHU2750 TaxID=1825976 RepID=UPI000E772632|nr:transcriptional regulator [Neorhizobium sp. NCHU2750]
MNLHAKLGLDDVDGAGLPKALWAYNVIRDAIITMKLAPGETLNEKETCAELGISRTPMREAVLRLAQEGLVNIVPSGGTFVNKIVLRKVIEGHLVRSSLEMRTVRLAARNFDPVHERDLDLLIFRQQDAAKRRDIDEAFKVDNEFHRLLCRIAGFPNVWQTIHNATGQLDRVRRLAFPKIGYFEEVIDEHSALYAAIRGHDESEAARLLKIHLGGIFPVVEFVLQTDADIITGEDDAVLLKALAEV